MRKLVYILFLCLLSFIVKGQTTYYVSTTGNDANNGTSEATAWQTLSKVNSQTFSAGDSILFKRDDTLYGSITVSNSGSSGSPITYGAYGTGANPIITGFTTVSSWTNLGSNIWESTSAVSTLSTLKQVVINNVTIPMGATPNRDATYPFLPNYYTYQSHTGTGSGTTTLTSNSLDGTDWTGSDVVVRANHWTLDKESITASSGTTITYSGQTAGTDNNGLEDGWGFFIQNDARTLDIQNEWYYNPSTKKIRIYSTTNPGVVQVTTQDTLFYATPNYIKIDNINFKGANTSAVVFSNGDNETVTNCDFSFTGGTALIAQNTSNNLLVDNCTFSDFGGAGIWNSDGGANWILTNNTFIRCNLVSPFKPNDYTNAPIETSSPNALIQYNYIDSTAYEGIHFRGSGTQVRNNFVNHTSLLRDDGGGIYTGFTGETGKIIDHNIVLNSIGNGRGVVGGNSAGNGLYMDGRTDSATVTNNFVAHIQNAGIFLNNDRGMNVHNNTVYDAGDNSFTKGSLMVQSYDDVGFASYQRSNNVTNNIFFPKRSNQYSVFFYESPGGSNTVQNFGILDSNIYVKATDNTVVRYDKYNTTATDITLSGWQTASGQESHGTSYAGNGSIDTSKIKIVYNPTKSDSVVALDAVYKDVKGNTYSGSITLPSYTGSILMYDAELQVTQQPFIQFRISGKVKIKDQ